MDTPYPLGRRVEHDERSRAHPVLAPLAYPLRTLAHRSYGLPLDQIDLGSCTGNAAAGAINTVPCHYTGERVLDEHDAVGLYSLATKLDEFAGTYPPNDTGSSGLAAAKAAQQLGYITQYRHAFTMAQALAALQLGPVITGTNWTDDMFTPTAQGFVHPTGQVAGGHEYLVRGYVAAKRPYILCMNSWGAGWGPLGGKFKMFVDEWEQLLAADGDVTVLVR
jgi:papain like protease